MEETLLNVTNSGSNGEEYWEYVEVRPWTRFWARILDYIVFVSLIFFISKTLLKLELNEGYSFLLYLTAVFIWVFVEAVFLSAFGATPGKWLFNITLRDNNGKKLRLVPALSRSMSVWFYGLGTGIPLLCFIGMGIQYNKLVHMKTTRWDAKRKYSIRYNYLKWFKTTIIVCVYAAFVISRIVIPQIKWGAEIGASIQYPDYSIASTFNSNGCAFMNSGDYDKARNEFIRALACHPNNSLRNTLYNNLSLACYHLEEYDEALKYSREGLSIQGNDAVEYSNYGNALYACGDASEAEKAYRKSLELDKRNAYAYYGLGQIKYYNYEYGEAITAFDEYTSLKKDDADGWCYLGLAYLYENRNMPKAKECLDLAVKISPDNIFAISSMADYYSYNGESQKAEEVYADALERNGSNYELICDIAEYYKNEEKYEDALKYADQAVHVAAREYRAHSIMSQIYFMQGERQKAIEAANIIIRQCPDEAEAFAAVGELFYNEYEYRLAVDIYNRALLLDPANEDLVIGKISSLYYSKRYTDCLESALEAANKFDNYEIPWYIADVYSKMGDSEKALDYYHKALGKKEDDVNLLISLGWEYYYNEDYLNAGLYADKALKADSSDYSAKEIKKAIENRRKDIMDQVAQFIEENYMYFKADPEYDAVKSSLKTNKASGMEDIQKLFDAAHDGNDLFSFVLSGENYEKYLKYESENTVEHQKINDKADYIRIFNFSRNTANEFLDIIDHIENTQDKYLIIDLRDNGGGDTTSGCDILDFLLPDSVVCNLIDKDGYSSPYYSDEDYIRFKHIFVFTNEGSASCSELLSLGLKTYLDNVSIIGRKTFGKGVGQILFEDKARGFAIFLVNHYWNVREVNITGEGIQPDRQVKGNDTESYMSEVYKMVDNIDNIDNGVASKSTD